MYQKINNDFNFLKEITRDNKITNNKQTRGNKDKAYFPLLITT